MRQALGARQRMRPATRRAFPLSLLCSLLFGLVIVPGGSIAARPAAQSDTLCTAPATVTFPDASGETAANDDAGATPIATPASVLNPTPSPNPSPIASPVAQVAPDEIGQITALVDAIGACQNERRARTMTKFVTEGYLGDFYAGGGAITIEQFVEFARGLPRVPVTIVSVNDVQIDGKGTATAEVVSTIGMQLFRATWSFVFVPADSADATGSEPNTGVWLADGVEPLPVETPDGAREIDVKIGENRYDPNSLRVRGPDFAINARNTSDEDHELLVLSLADGVTTRDLLTAPGPELPDGITVLGQVTIPADSNGALVLIGVEPGTYAIVDLLLTDQGTPHLALGMEATLTVR